MEIKKFLIDEEKTMVEAMRLLDEVAKKILFVTKDDDFVASITDGDIRRWILKKGNLDAKVKDIANYNPKYLEEEDKHKAKKYMKKYKIDSIPIVDKEGRIITIVFLKDKDIRVGKDLDIPVIIMAGGFGTRLYPYTKILPKPLIPIGDIPITEHIINRFNEYGCKDFTLIVNHKKNMIKAYFNEIEKNYTVSYADEDIPLGTGGGLSLLKGKINSTFILSNCDILIDTDYEKLYKFHKKENNLITMICSLKHIKIPYGVVEINDKGEIDEMKEKPELSFFTNTGVYIAEPKIIEELKENEKIGFPDIINKYKELGEKIGIYPISENSWLDMGQFDQMEEMRRVLEKKK